MENNLEKMLKGKLYNPTDIEIQKKAKKSHRLCQEYNALNDTDPRRKEILKELLPHASESIYLQGDIYFDYGEFTYIGENFYANQTLRVLDTCPIHIGNNVYFGMNVTLATPIHPLLGSERKYYKHEDGAIYDDEYAKPIYIGDDCWFACNVTICPGVTIGNNVVIGAGSVVTRDIPDNSLAFGVPCKVVRKLTKEDSIKYKKELY